MSQYRGRFAPSPSGPLHFGSLVAALGSWLDARHQQGEWLVRMEDIDPPREVAGAADTILRTLENYGLYWDQQVSYQSSNLQRYEHVLEQLVKEGLVYPCTCTRKQIQSTGGIYQNVCRGKQRPANISYSLRLKVNQPLLCFTDSFQGDCKTDPASAAEDFILKRKDGYYAYMLAVVVDDHQQQISTVIRGADLLETTTQQLTLFGLINAKPPRYGHLPVVVNEKGLKLSKQNHAVAISESNVSENLWSALAFLKQSPPEKMRDETKEVLLAWAVQHWDPKVFTGSRQFFHQDI